jgi:hypothetical protein
MIGTDGHRGGGIAGANRVRGYVLSTLPALHGSLHILHGASFRALVFLWATSSRLEPLPLWLQPYFL